MLDVISFDDVALVRQDSNSEKQEEDFFSKHFDKEFVDDEDFKKFLGGH